MPAYGYGSPQAPQWAVDLVGLLGAGIGAAVPALIAKKSGKAVAPAIGAVSGGVIAKIAEPYVGNPYVAEGMNGVAYGALGYGWVFAAANLFGAAQIPMIAQPAPSSTTSTSTSTSSTTTQGGTSAAVSAARSGAARALVGLGRVA